MLKLSVNVSRSNLFPWMTYRGENDGTAEGDAAERGASMTGESSVALAEADARASLLRVTASAPADAV